MTESSHNCENDQDYKLHEHLFIEQTEHIDIAMRMKKKNITFFSLPVKLFTKLSELFFYLFENRKPHAFISNSIDGELAGEMDICKQKFVDTNGMNE